MTKVTMPMDEVTNRIQQLDVQQLSMLATYIMMHILEEEHQKPVLRKIMAWCVSDKAKPFWQD